MVKYNQVPTDMQEVLPTEAAYLAPDAARQAALQERIDYYLKRGYRVVSQTDTTAQLVRPKRFSFVWFLVSILTFVGWIPYLFYHLFLKRERQVYLHVDGVGIVQERSSKR